MLRLLSLRCRLVPSKFCFGLQSAWSHDLCIDFFLPRPAPSCKLKLQVYECIIYCVYMLLPKEKSLCQIKTSEPLQLHKASAPELSRTLPSTCTGTLQNFTGYLHQNPPQPHRLSAPHPSRTICIGTLQNLTRYCICTETFRNRTRYLHNLLEPYQIPAPEPCATSPAICIETP